MEEDSMTTTGFKCHWSDGAMLLFPLSRPPLCRTCYRPRVRGNQGLRHYYYCPCTAHDPDGSAWGTWDDDAGIEPENPVCDCGYYSRLMINNTTRSLFVSCSVGECDMLVHRAMLERQAAFNSGITLPLQQVPGVSYYNHIPATPIVCGPRSALRAITKPFAANEEPDVEFIRLLNHAMDAARRGTFPGRFGAVPNPYESASAMQKKTKPILPAAEQHHPYLLESNSDFERHAKISAAGELFTFAMLNKTSMEYGTRLFREDWRSNLRNLIRKHHPLFRRWTEWKEQETADIVVPDDDGSLTCILVEHGYLDGNTWIGQRPIYLFEVKTTLSNKSKEFFLSTNQYRRMEANANPQPSRRQRPVIHIIARVSNLQEFDINLKLYVNPDARRQEGHLRFRQVWVAEETETDGA